MKSTFNALSSANILNLNPQTHDPFLATMAHELRNPLAPIRNAVQILKVVGPPDPKLVRGRDVIDRQVAKMARLLDDLLDVNRITRNQLDLRKSLTTLSAVVESAIEISRPLIEKMNHRLTVSLPNETITLNADAMRLAQVFANILNNAAKYSDPGGQIELSAMTKEDRVVVFVKDNGIGIDPEHQEHVFTMFSQTTSALERSQGGLGIGLSLVKGLVELHGGEVEARSDGAGKGSEFIVRLPLVTGQREPAMKDDADSCPQKSALRILIADDNEDGAKTLSAMLNILGNETWIASDGEAAITAANELCPDIILLDIGLPRLNGYQVCRNIRQEPWGKQIAIVAHTGWGQEEDRQKTLDAGFDYHLVKPANMAKLTQLLNELQPLKSEPAHGPD